MQTKAKTWNACHEEKTVIKNYRLNREKKLVDERNSNLLQKSPFLGKTILIISPTLTSGR